MYAHIYPYKRKNPLCSFLQFANREQKVQDVLHIYGHCEELLNEVGNWKTKLLSSLHLINFLPAGQLTVSHL